MTIFERCQEIWKVFKQRQIQTSTLLKSSATKHIMAEHVITSYSVAPK
jgi:hypothetical protein